MIPKHLAPLFWDTNLAVFEPQAHAAYTIGRVLEHGDGGAVAWMRQAFAEDAITAVLRTEHRLTIRSANFWALYFKIPAHEIASLRT